VGRWILIDVVGTAAVLLLSWYLWFSRSNRRRGAAVLEWVEAACQGRGRIVQARWQASSSVLQATLRLSWRWFEDARLTICLLPRPLPLRWLLSRWRKQEETLTFEANMGFPPGFHMDVVRYRWAGQTTAKKSGRTRSWAIARPSPVVLTTTGDWPVEVTPVVSALTSWRDKDFLSVRFDPFSPHFTATVGLASLPDENAAVALFGLFRELAASSSAKQH